MTNATAAIAIPAAVVAHQGGWDEILLVAGPIVVVVALLALARRRVTRNAAMSDERPQGAHRSSRHHSLDGDER